MITGGNFNKNIPPVEDMEVDEVRERVQRFDNLMTCGVIKKETCSCDNCNETDHGQTLQEEEES